MHIDNPQMSHLKTRVSQQVSHPAQSCVMILPRLQNCGVAAVPPLPALRQLDLDLGYVCVEQQPRVQNLSQQPCLERLQAQRRQIGRQLPASLQRLEASDHSWQEPHTQAEVEDLAAALRSAPLLQHLKFLVAAFPGELLPTAVAGAIDSLPRLRSLHFISCKLSAMPALACLSRLTSFGLAGGGELPQFPPLAAQLTRCRDINFSRIRFMDAGNAARVLTQLEAAAAAADCAPAARFVYLLGVRFWPGGAVVAAQVRAFGKGVWAVEDGEPSEPPETRMMSFDDKFY